MKILESTASKITIWSHQRNPINKEEQVVIQYGIEVILENVIKYLALLLLGILLHKTGETIIILISFALLRSQAGGYHAETNLGCMLWMVGMWASGIFARQLISISLPVLVPLWGIAVLGIYLFAPSGKRVQLVFDENMKRKKRWYSYCITSFLFIAALQPHWRCSIVIPVMIEVLSLVNLKSLA